MSKRKRAEAAVLEQEVGMENRKRELLEAYLPDGLDRETSNRILDALSILSQFTPEELQRLETAALLLMLERLNQMVTELQRLSLSEVAPLAKSNGVSGGFDVVYFRGRILQELGIEPDDDTLERVAQLAGDPSRLERAIIATRKYLDYAQVENPLGVLINKLRRWQEMDSANGRRQRN
jgi:hypothetical protein